MRKKILIIGNGFDIDLGLGTSYTSFYESKYWPFKSHIINYNDQNVSTPQSLRDAFLLAKRKKYWFDIEAILGEYACNRHLQQYTTQQIDDDKNDYYALVSALESYLKDIQSTSPINTGSVAAKVFYEIINNEYFSKIYSFNYTNLKSIANSLHISKDFLYTHMHGSLDNHIILGIESRMDFNSQYRFMCKEYSQYYETRLLIRDLEESQEIVIFGHSLGHIDYHYFRPFFKRQSAEVLTKEQSKHITIFTYDVESQRDICDQLRAMNDRRLDCLFGNNILQIFRTSDCIATPQFVNYIKHLHDTSKKADNSRLNHLASML